jgi:archaemetzincin
MIALRVAPLEALEAGLLASVAESLRAGYGVDVEVAEPLGAPEFAWDAARNQCSAPLILKRLLETGAPGDKILAVTGRDLYIPMLSFVYGQAQLGGRAGVISVARLRMEYYGLAPDAELLRVRAGKEALHEAGHLFGLLHCPDTLCAMTISTGIRQLDLKQPALCAGCAALAGEQRRVWEGAAANATASVTGPRPRRSGR